VTRVKTWPLWGENGRRRSLPPKKAIKEVTLAQFVPASKGTKNSNKRKKKKSGRKRTTDEKPAEGGSKNRPVGGSWGGLVISGRNEGEL